MQSTLDRLFTEHTRYHFTRLEQVTALVAASEADTGFMARRPMLCTLLGSNLRDRLQYVCHNGPVDLARLWIGLRNHRKGVTFAWKPSTKVCSFRLPLS